MRKVSSAIEQFEWLIQNAKKRLNLDALNRLREEMTESEIENMETFLEVFSGHINTYSQEEFLDEMKEAQHALGNLDPEGKIEWVSEEKMTELSDEYDMEDYFSNNAAIIMECHNYKEQKNVWFICLIKR